MIERFESMYVHRGILDMVGGSSLNAVASPKMQKKSKPDFGRQCSHYLTPNCYSGIPSLGKAANRGDSVPIG